MNIIIGLLSGIAASMGFGGGFILIIYLVTFTGTDQITAQGVNLVFFLPIALISLIFHAKNRLIEWRILPLLIIAGTFGVAAGAFLAEYIEVAIIKKLFSSLLIYVGMREIFHRNAEKYIDKK